MKTIGIIVEYNPFHNGHLYQIEKARQLTDADAIVVIMSGDFVQRGTPAIIDKYARTKMALEHGVDLVIELPLLYATASAEYFATGAVQILDGLKIIDTLVFGSECGDLSLLSEISQILIDEPDYFREKLKEYIKTGETFPAARKHALYDYLSTHHDDAAFLKNADEVLDHPNNILGIEYIKALLRLKSSITPFTIKREGAGYHDTDHTMKFSSATSLRKYFHSVQSTALPNGSSVTESIIDSLAEQLPDASLRILSSEYQKTFPISANDFSSLLYYRLSQETKESLTAYADITEDLANRIIGHYRPGITFTAFAEGLKSRQYTLTRINRCLLHILLGIREQDLAHFLSTPDSRYARILGFKKTSSHLLKRSKENEGIPIITKTADAPKQLPSNAMSLFTHDIRASHLYNQIVFTTHHTLLKDDYTHGPIML